MNVTACVATRGDVDMQPILDSFPDDWETIVWNNGSKHCVIDGTTWVPVKNLGPHARFAAIKYASHDLIYVQDDDVIVSDPGLIVAEWLDILEGYDRDDVVVCNMPPEFRSHYPDSAMVGFGAAFHRDAPELAFRQWDEHGFARDDLFLRESCRIFTVLTPQYLVDVPKVDMPYASDPNRLWKQPGHVQSRDKALGMARQVRDAH